MKDVVWITGASAGLGQALARELRDRGHTVAASARSADKLAELAAEPGGGPGSIHAYPLDVTDAAATATTLDRIEHDLGVVRTAVLNAGTHIPMPAAEFRADTVAELVELNLLATAKGIEALLPRMRARGEGHIAVVASVAGYRGLPTAAAYGASKAAVINMCEALHPELAAMGITLQVVNPGFVRTPLTDRNEFPMPALMEAQDAARVFADGLGSRRFEITFPRRFTWTMKVLRCLPYAAYFALTRRLVASER